MQRAEQAHAPEARATGEHREAGSLELVGLEKRFGDVRAVEALSLQLRQGEFFSLLGPSGCGKTTTLRMIAGFETPTRGRVLLDGMDVTSLPANHRPTNTVFQSYALFSHLDVGANVEFGLREDRVPKGERRDRVREALAMVRLERFELRRPEELSGGQQQRVALARAIVKRPRVLLLDEPLGALDLKLRKAMQIELKQIQERLGMTFVYVTHDQEEALTMSDRIAVMRAGRVEQLDGPEAVYDRPVTRFVAEFIGAANVLTCSVDERATDRLAIVVGGKERARRIGARASASAGLDPGDPGWVVIRPERCRLGPEDDERAPLRGRIAEVLFQGTHRSYLVELSPDTVLTVAEPHRPSDEQARVPGDLVTIDWSEADAWVVAA